MSLFDELVKDIRHALKATEHGRKLMASWSDARIKEELKEPVFFGAKTAIKTKDRAVAHFKKLAEYRK